MNRNLRYSANTYQSLLRQNGRHAFAMRHALRIYASNAIYSFIPKNACSTMRVSLALANGCIRDVKDYNWIHQNNDTFNADLASTQTAAYTFVILRCPYARLASAYLNKIVGHYPEAWQLYDLTERKREVSSMSFDFFIRQLQKPMIRDANIHWRPQTDFLLYEHYDDYFSLENFSVAQQSLALKLGLTIVDARDLTKHGRNQFIEIGEQNEYSKHSAFEIMQLKHNGQCPTLLSLYNDELVAIVRNCYRDDIQLYQSLFGPQQLLFDG